MLDVVQKWVLGFAGAAVFCAVAEAMTPEGKAKSVQKMLCGAVLTIALFYPVINMDFEAYSLNLALYKTAAEASRDKADNLSRLFIEERCAAYILDKAKEKGQDISSVKVSVKWSSEGVWYPVGAEIEGNYSAELSRLIETELGIKREDQVWNENA